MFFEFINRNRTIKELRKDIGYTANELAAKLKMENTEILSVDNKKLKELEEPLRSKMLPVLRSDHMGKIPW
jgi:ribosome-binding protein aMBF1 (putative translation factor)